MGMKSKTTGIMFAPVPVMAALLLGFLCCQRPAPSQEEGSFAEKVDWIIRSQDDLFSGVVFAAVGDRVLFNKGYGLADRPGHGFRALFPGSVHA